MKTVCWNNRHDMYTNV